MRIITGSARGARLMTPKGLTTRPTADRVKEAVFSILGEKVRDRHVLDLFAGSGALGLEALSRGAASCTFVDTRTGDLIEKNAQHTHLSDRSHIVSGDVLAYLARCVRAGSSFDLIFSDPPYKKGLSEAVLRALSGNEILAHDGILLLEHGKEEGPFEAEELSLVLNRSYGSVTGVSFYQRASYLAKEAMK